MNNYLLEYIYHKFHLIRYIIFDLKEKKEYLDIVKKDLLNYKLEELQKQINLYKSILDNSKSDQSKEKYQSSHHVYPCDCHQY